MGSILNSRYWTCPHCFTQFDWEASESSSNHPDSHDSDKCLQRRLEEKSEIASTEQSRRQLSKR